MEAENERPFGDLPLTHRVLLTENRIEAAVIEIRFVGAARQMLAEDAASMLSLLSTSTTVTRLDTAEQRELSVTFVGGEAQPLVGVTSRGWRFSSPDENLLITVLSDMALIQVRGYERWSVSLRPQLEAVLAALNEFSAPAIVQRLGLRYINHLAGVSGEPASAWSRRIAAAFRGPLDEPVLGPLLRGAHQQLELELESDAGALIRHGLVPSQAGDEFGYLIDVDVFHTRSMSFAAADVVDSVQRLNRTAARLFMRMLTDEQIEDIDPIAIDVNTQTEGGTR